MINNSNSKPNSIEDFQKLINDYFSKEKENSNIKYRKKLSKIIFDYIIKTDDGLYTINSPDFDGKVETIHNLNGTITESFERFVKPFKDSYFQNNNINDIINL